MATYQYRINGVFDWQSTSGNAIVALTNKPSSGKKISVRAVEIGVVDNINNVTSALAPVRLHLSRATASGIIGEDVTPVGVDTNTDTWPSGVRLVHNAVHGTATDYFGSTEVFKLLSTAALPAQAAMVQRFYESFRRPFRDTDTEPIVLRAGEGLVLTCDIAGRNLPLRVEATIVRSGSPDETYRVSYATYAALNKAVLGLANDTGSGEVVSVYDITVTDIGGLDSPYFQLVPIGAVIEPEAAQSVSFLKLDTSDPNPATWAAAYANIPVLPYGLPENALSDASIGNPKGSNYLKSKDFIGPVFRVFFAEAGALVNIKPDAMHICDIRAQELGLVGPDSAIVLREGEGIALVSASELATSGLSIVPSGRAVYEIAITFDVDPKLVPTLTLTGLQNPSEVRIFESGTTTEIAGQEDVTTGTYSTTFDPEATPEVDISILSLGYQNMRLKELALTLADVTIPVQQQIDRQYYNP